jgi:metallo-beta-lactamase class B
MFAFALLLAVQLQSGLSVEMVEEGLWLHRSDKDWGDGKSITSNGLFVVGDEALAMIDTAWTDEQTAELIDWAEKRFGRPVRYVISTHWHWDRMGGMAEVNRRGIDGYALGLSAELGADHGIDAPHTTFTSSIRLDLGNEVLETFYPGPGHTVDNTVVWLAQRKILAGGCLIKSAGSKSLGYTDEADIPAWGDTLDRVLERYGDARVVVPGHGKIADVSLIRHTRELVDRELATD